MKAIKLALVLAALVVLPVIGRAGETVIPDLDESRLTIPWSDFKELLELIQPEDGATEKETPPLPPVDYTITSAHYAGKREDGSAAFDFTIAFTVLAEKKWVSVPILPAELALEDLRLDGGEALIADGGGWHQLMMLGPGPHTVIGKFYMPFGNALGPATVSVPLPQTPVTTLDFVVPEPGLEIKAEPANVNRMSWPEGASALAAVLPPAGRVTVSWSRKVEGEQAALRVNAEVESLVSLGERLCQVESVVRYEILHRGVTGFKLALPSAAAVVDVRGTGLADWKAQKLGEGQEVQVNLNYEAKGRYDLTVLYETALENATAEVIVPVIQVRDVSRESGHLGVTALTSIEVEPKKLENLAVLDVAQLPDALAYRSGSPLLYGYKYIGQPWSLVIQVTKHEDVEVLNCACDKAVLNTFLTEEGEAVTRAIYALRNNSEQFIRIELPEGARVLSAARSDKPIKPARDGKFILLPLEKAVGASGEALSFTVELTYLAQLDRLSKYRGAIDLPAPKTNVITHAMEWRVYLPRDYAYEVNEKNSTLDIRPGSYDYSAGKPSVSDGRESGDPSIYNDVNYGLMEIDKKSSGKGDVDEWVKEMNRDNDAAQAELPFHAEMTPQPNVMLSIDTSGSMSMNEKTTTAAVLPVAFEVPEKGVRIDFEKALVKEGEENAVAVKYKKKIELPAGTRRIAAPAAVVFALCFLAWILMRIRRRRLRPGTSAPQAGPGKEVSP